MSEAVLEVMGAVELDRSSGPTASFEVPGDAEPGQTIHVVAEAADDGSPALTRYERFVVSVIP